MAASGLLRACGKRAGRDGQAEELRQDAAPPAPKKRKKAKAAASSARKADLGRDALEGSELLAWLRSKGGLFEGAALVSAGNAGFRLVASRDLPAGHVVARVPHECVLSAASCSELPLGQKLKSIFDLLVEDSEGAALPGESGKPVVTVRSALYLALMVAPEDAGNGEAAPLGPLLCELRSCAADTPFTWGTGSFASLSKAWCELPPLIAEEWQGHLDAVRGEYEALFPRLSQAYPEVFPAKQCTEEAWLRAHSLYTSRALPLKPEQPMPDECLLPLVDRFNHDSNANTANVLWRGAGTEDERGAATIRAVKKGEELLISYGCKGNAELALGYGFAVWGNPHEKVRLRLDLADFVSPESDAWASAAAAFEEEAAKHLEFCVPSESGPSVTFTLGEDDLGAEDGPWTALRPLFGLVGALSAEAEPAEAGSDGAADPKAVFAQEPDVKAAMVLGDLLERSEESLAGGSQELEPEEAIAAWEARLTRARKADRIRVGSADCAASREGVVTALRHAQLSVVLKALECLQMEGESADTSDGEGRLEEADADADAAPCGHTGRAAQTP